MHLLGLLKSRFFSHSPVRLMHDVTYQCNCKCSICDRWKQSNNWKDDLSFHQICEMLDDAKKAGLLYYVALGGEPLSRKDISQILAHAKQLQFHTSIVTNGHHLKDVYKTLLPVTDSIVVSLDSNDTIHDQIRGVEGLRKRVIEGIKVCIQNNMNICINSVLCKTNLHAVDGLASLANTLKTPIVFQNMGLCKGYNDHLIPDHKKIQETFRHIIQLKKDGYNIANSYRYLHQVINNDKFICHAPKYMIHVEANGNIVSCIDMIYKKWGNIKEKTFDSIFKDVEFKDFCTQVEQCNKCPVTCVIEGSYLYSLYPLYILDKICFSQFHFV